MKVPAPLEKNNAPVHTAQKVPQFLAKRHRSASLSPPWRGSWQAWPCPWTGSRRSGRGSSRHWLKMTLPGYSKGGYNAAKSASVLAVNTSRHINPDPLEVGCIQWNCVLEWSNWTSTVQYFPIVFCPWTNHVVLTFWHRGKNSSVQKNC